MFLHTYTLPLSSNFRLWSYYLKLSEQAYNSIKEIIVFVGKFLIGSIVWVELSDEEYAKIEGIRSSGKKIVKIAATITWQRDTLSNFLKDTGIYGCIL